MNNRVGVLGCAAALSLVGLVAGCGDINVAESDGGGGVDTSEDASKDASEPQTCEYGEDGSCDDGNSCTVDTCLITGVCAHEPLANACKIDGQCFVDGTTAPANACQVCDIAQSKTAWTSVVCDDGQPCTRDECTASSGCVFLADDSLPCDDGLACSTDDRCSGGQCVATDCGCESDADCAELAAPCKAVSCMGGECVVVPDGGQDGSACDDGDPCTVGDSCAAGECAGTAMDCSELDDACHEGACQDGSCAAVALSGIPCDDEDPCTAEDTCDAGGACGGTWDPVACTCASDADCTSLNGPCSVGQCDLEAANCVAAPTVDAPCDDGDACTHGDLCDAGGACAGTPYVCEADSGCEIASCDGAGGCDVQVAEGGCYIEVGGVETCFAEGGVNPDDPCQICDPEQATDAWSVAADGAPCGPEAGECETPSACAGGVCQAGGFKDVGTACGDATETACDKPDLCDGAGFCLPAYVQAGIACDDGDPANGLDACDGAGQCVGAGCSGDADCGAGAAGACFEGAGVCDVANGVCVHTPKASNVACDDGNPATVGDHCDGIGHCVGNLPCTAHGCDAPSGPCDVAPGACDAGTGVCSFDEQPVGTPCDDQNPATLGDRCHAGGVCAGDLDTPPWIAALDDLRVQAGTSGATLRLFAGEGLHAAEAAQTVTVAVVDSSAPDVLPVEAVTVVCEDDGRGCYGKLVIDGPLEVVGEATLTLEASDGQATTQATVTVTVVDCSADSQVFLADGSFAVPEGCNFLEIEAWGAGGGSGERYSGRLGGNGGGGGYAAVGLGVTPGESLEVLVGQGGLSGKCSGSPVPGGDGAYAGGAADGSGAGSPGDGPLLGGVGGQGIGNGYAGGQGGYGGGGGGHSGYRRGGSGGAATVVRSAAGADLVVAGGGGGGSGGPSDSNTVPGSGGGGCGQPGISAVGDKGGAGGGGGGGACEGDVTSPAQGRDPKPAAPEGGARGGTSTDTNQCLPDEFGGDGAAVLRVRGDWAGGGLGVADGAAWEGALMTFEVTVAPLDASKPVTFSWTTRPLSGEAGVDFVAAGGVVSVPAGQTTTTLTVATLDNAWLDGLRLVEVVVADATNVVVRDPVGLGFIGDDEACEGAATVEDADGRVLLGMGSAYADEDGDGFTGAAEAVCVLFGHALPEGYVAQAVAPPALGWNAALAERVGPGSSWSSEHMARVEAGYATTSQSPGSESEWLVLRDWKLGLPEAAKVLGVRVHVTRETTCDNQRTMHDSAVQLVLGGEVVGANRAASGPWSQSKETVTYGGPSDSWEVALTGAEVNGADFGVAVRTLRNQQCCSCQARVHHVWIEVFTDQGVDCAPEDPALYRTKDVHVDADGDMYSVGASESVCMGEALPAEYATGYALSSFGTDCYDGNANAFPGSTYFGTSHRGDGSYDYDCDGATTANASSCYSCAATVSTGTCATYTGTCTKGAPSVVYNCTAAQPYACGSTVPSSSCALTYRNSACTTSTTTVSSGSGTHTTFCSTSAAGYTAVSCTGTATCSCR